MKKPTLDGRQRDMNSKSMGAALPPRNDEKDLILQRQAMED